MTDYNILYISTGNYGAPAGRLLPLMQGQFGQVIPLEIRNLDGSIPDLTGYTFAATKRQGSTVTAWVGSIVLSGTPAAAPQAMMTVDEDDTGQGGAGPFFLEITNGTQVLKTHPVSLTITPDPAVNDTPAAGLVGVTPAQKALLATIAVLTGLVKMAAGTATGIAVQSFMETFLGSANAATALTNIGALPEDASIVAVSGARDLASTDAGKILECTGTFTLTCPNGLDTGFQCAVVNISTGVITLAATTTITTKDSAVTLASQYGGATVYHAGSNVWRAIGDLS